MHEKTIHGTKVVYYKRTRSSKKWMTCTPDGKIVHRGDPDMKDYTQHHDKREENRIENVMLAYY
jgi:Fe2+ or Zn2+ uptake regulation protein